MTVLRGGEVEVMCWSKKAEDGEREVLTSTSLRMKLSGLWAHLGLPFGPGQLPPEAGAHRGEEGKKRRIKGREGGREGRQILAPL